MSNLVVSNLVKWLVLAAILALFISLIEPGTIEDMLYFREDVSYLSQQHLQLALVSGLAAVVVAIPLGILFSRPSVQRYAEYGMQFLNVGATIPTLALLAMSMAFLGIGFIPSVFALFVITLLPIVRNTYVGLLAVPSFMHETARGMGMNDRQKLLRVELPNAMSVIFAGIRTAFALNVGTVPIAYLIGGGGLGELVFMGIRLDDTPMMLAGALATAAIAVIIDISLGLLSMLCIPKGIRLATAGH